MFKTIKNIFIGILIGIFLSGLLWFFTGKNNFKPILTTSAAISENNGRIESVGNSLTIRLDTIEETITNISDTSKELESGIGTFNETSERLDEESKSLEWGLEEANGRIEIGEERHGLIVGIVSELRSLNEDFYRATRKGTVKN